MAETNQTQPLKSIVPFFSFLFCLANGFSQKAKPVNGKVTAEDSPVKGTEIVNMSSKKITTTSQDGSFTLLAKPGDQLYVVSKNYIDRKIVLTESDFNSLLIVRVEPKPEELEEVEVGKTPAVKLRISQAEINARDLARLQKQASSPKVQGVYTGEIANGIDFIRLGKDVAGLFKGKDKAPPKPAIIFKEYLSAHYTEAFYLNTLKLKAEQVFAFIDYCDADPGAAAVVQKNNPLAVMEFLMAKSDAFKKLE